MNSTKEKLTVIVAVAAIFVAFAVAEIWLTGGALSLFYKSRTGLVHCSYSQIGGMDGSRFPVSLKS